MDIFVLSDIFLNILKSSVIASLVILCVLLARVLLKKCPKVFSYALWALVLVRLLLPSGLITSSVSVSRPVESVSGTIDNLIDARAQEVYTQGSPGFDAAVASGSDPYESDGVIMANEPHSTADKLILAASIAWISGMAFFTVYGFIAYIKLKKSVRFAVKDSGNVYLSDSIPTAFVLGIIKPKIYLPYEIGENRCFVLEHERVHIRRHDFIVKLIALTVVVIHWFNPLMWLAYRLMNRDMEMSCDEASLRKIGNSKKSDYSEALLSMAAPKAHLVSVPLAFGEGNAKQRIKNVLSFKKPTFWVIIMSAVLLCAVAVFSLTKSAHNLLDFGEHNSVKVSEALDKAISDAIIDYSGSKSLRYAGVTYYPIAAYDILGTDTVDNKVTVYCYVNFSEYGFMNGYFTSCGSGWSSPAVINFTQNGGKFTDYKITTPKDGADNYESTKQLFPQKYWHDVLDNSDASEKRVEKQKNSIAEGYIKELGLSDDVPVESAFYKVGYSILPLDVGIYEQLCDLNRKRTGDALSLVPDWNGTRLEKVGGEWTVFLSKWEDDASTSSFSDGKISFASFKRGSTTAKALTYTVNGSNISFVGEENISLDRYEYLLSGNPNPTAATTAAPSTTYAVHESSSLAKSSAEDGVSNIEGSSHN